MYDQIREDTLYIMSYTAVTALATIASCYLLLRQGNAFAAHIKTPPRLRRFTAAFFAAFALNHLWYIPIFFHIPARDVTMIDLTGGLLDSLTLFPLAIIVLLTMLQDRRRPLWPVLALMSPIILAGLWGVAARSYALLPWVYAYSLLAGLCLILYMVREVRRYGRWLRDNYADLEHKEIWQSFVVLAIILLVFGAYVFTSQGPAYQYSMQLIIALLICCLLWRVETLSDLSDLGGGLKAEGGKEPSTLHQQLQRHCIDTRLYLQHDLTLTQLAKAVGTNRTYLGQYFSSQGLTYNAYINDLRVNHFVNLYQEAAAAHHPFTAQQLALESGFRSYRTFSEAFKRKTGQSVTAWTKDQSSIHPA